MEYKELTDLKTELLLKEKEINLLGFYIAPTDFQVCNSFLQDYWKTYGLLDYKNSLLNDKFLKENSNYLNQDLNIYVWTTETQKAFEEGSNHIMDLSTFRELQK